MGGTGRVGRAYPLHKSVLWNQCYHLSSYWIERLDTTTSTSATWLGLGFCVVSWRGKITQEKRKQRLNLKCWNSLSLLVIESIILELCFQRVMTATMFRDEVSLNFKWRGETEGQRKKQWPLLKPGGLYRGVHCFILSTFLNVNLPHSFSSSCNNNES